jgi:hypothetical protein
MKPKMINPVRPKIGGLDYFGVLTDETKGIRKQVYQLTNKEKENVFSSVFDSVKKWKDKISNLDGVGNLSERTGIYTSLYSLYEYRLETLWLNYAYQRQWSVYRKIEIDYDSKTGQKTDKIIDNRFYPMSFKNWIERFIPPKLKITSIYLVDLYGKQMGNQKSEVNDEQLIPYELFDRISASNKDRKEIIHKNCFYKKDISNEHIESVIKNFRGIDKIVKKHQRECRELLIDSKIPHES